MENLEKSNYVKALRMIKEDDVSGIISEINQGNVKCIDSSMNFNFLLLSVLYMSFNVFKALQESEKCEKILNEDKDKVFQLTPLDYAFMLKRSELIDYYKKNYSSAVDNLQAHSKVMHEVSHIMCNLFNNELSGVIWAGILGLTTFVCIGKIQGIEVGGVIKYIGTAGVFSSRLIVEKSIKFVDCEKIFEYEAINITSPRDFDSLKQCKKYMMEDEEKAKVYVHVGVECSQGDEKLTYFGDYSVFQSPYYGDEKISFVLCQEVLEQEIVEV